MKEALQLNEQYDKGGPADLAHRIAEGILKGAIPLVIPTDKFFKCCLAFHELIVAL